MHLNCHTVYPRLAVNYFCKKLDHRCELQNTGVIPLIQFIICTIYYNCTTLSIYSIFLRKKSILQSFILNFFENKNSP